MKLKNFFENIKNIGAKIGKRNALIAFAALLICGAIILNVKLLDTKNDGYNNYDETMNNQSGVSAENTDYFASSIVSRERTRDEAMQVLQNVVDDENSDESTKARALSDLAAIASAIENESKIETLVIAKGFEQCVAVINGEKINVIVKCSGLNAGQIAQINEIVYEQTGILPININIIEKNA